MGRPTGAPTKYKPEYAKQAYKLCLLGHTDAELAQFFDVKESTINNWKKSQPEFLESVKSGKAIADGNVVESLFKRAMGYSHPEVDIKCYEGNIIKTRLTKRYPPDTTAAIFWLKNRQPQKWRDKHEIDHGGQPDNPIKVDNLSVLERLIIKYGQDSPQVMKYKQSNGNANVC